MFQMKYTAALILAVILGSQGCERSQVMYTVDKGIGSTIPNPEVKKAIEEVKKAFENAGLSQKINPFHIGNLPRNETYQLNLEILIEKKGNETVILKHVSKFLKKGKAATVHANYRVTMDKQNKPVIKLVHDTVFEKAHKLCVPSLHPKKQKARSPYIRHYYKTLDHLLQLQAKTLG
ncbi:hypothetical protein OSTOST_23190 [Ostertagia ostertagi]